MIPVIRFIDNLNIWVGKLFAWGILILTGAICYEVFVRYVLRSPTAWAYDVGYMLYGAVFIMAGAYALAKSAHVRGDVLFRLWAPRNQAIIEMVLYFIFFFPAVLALVYAGYGFAKLSWMMKETSSFSPAGPPLYHFKSLLPIAGAFLTLQGIAEVLRCVFCLRNGYWPERAFDVEEIEQIVLRGGEAPEEILAQLETKAVEIEEPSR